MDIEIIDENLLSELHEKAKVNERLRMNKDLRNSDEDTSQRMLNVMEPGTYVPIHRHLDTSETAICINGCLDWVFFEEPPDVNKDELEHNEERMLDENNVVLSTSTPTQHGSSEYAQSPELFKEIARIRVCPREHRYGIQVPLGVWHSVEVHEPSAIFEAKNGRYI